MSAFKRTHKPSAAPELPGTRPCACAPATRLLSTGLPALDDVLGSGLALGCALLLLAPDAHSAYGELALKHAAAQGVKAGHALVVVGAGGERWAGRMVWTAPEKGEREVEKGVDGEEGGKVAIAWRYANMKRVQTTVGGGGADDDGFCAPFDLGAQIPPAALTAADITYVSIRGEGDAVARALDGVGAALRARSGVVRVCVPALGAPEWGDLRPADVLRCVRGLRALVRAHGRAVVAAALAPHVSDAGFGGRGWLGRLGVLADGAVSLDAFGGDAALARALPGYHGLVRVLALPAPHTLRAPSDRTSALRGLAAGAGGENNLAFRCTRRRLVVETMHLDVEGGVGERRTAPADAADARHHHQEGLAKVAVAVEDAPAEPKKPKKKKTVGFRADRPEVYDF